MSIGSVHNVLIVGAPLASSRSKNAICGVELVEVPPSVGAGALESGDELEQPSEPRPRPRVPAMTIALRMRTIFASVIPVRIQPKTSCIRVLRANFDARRN